MLMNAFRYLDTLKLDASKETILHKVLEHIESEFAKSIKPKRNPNNDKARRAMIEASKKGT